MLKQTELSDSFLKIIDDLKSRQIKTVCFTSSSSKEGTTTIASAMAKIEASLGEKVLYCDFCDYETSLSKKYNQFYADKRGKPQDSINKNIIYLEEVGFYLLPAHKAKANSFEEADLGQILDHFKTEFDRIIIDTNYFNNHSYFHFSTENICQAADATILVVLSGGVLEEQIKQVCDSLRKKEIKMMGFVMNDVHYPKLVDELYEATHHLDDSFPKVSDKLRKWLKKSTFLNMEI